MWVSVSALYALMRQIGGVLLIVFKVKALNFGDLYVIINKQDCVFRIGEGMTAR